MHVIEATKLFENCFLLDFNAVLLVLGTFHNNVVLSLHTPSFFLLFLYNVYSIIIIIIIITVKYCLQLFSCQ